MDWEYLYKVFDILACIGVVVSLNLVTRFYKAWLLYIISCVFQVIVCVHIIACGHDEVRGLTIMGIVLMFTGIRNYWKERKKRKLILIVKDSIRKE